MSHFAQQFEENYLKELYKLNQKEGKKVNNIALAKALGLNPATVLEMVRKLAERGLVVVQSDKSLDLSDKGRKQALQIVRKHRLWEVFLVNKLNYRWNEVHALAEQLEHIGSEDLVNRLEAFLDFPAFDPHGDPIPDRQGRIKKNSSIALTAAAIGKTYRVVSFADTADSFLDYLESLPIHPGTAIKLSGRLAYDNSLTLLLNKKSVQLTEKVASNILVQPA